jgi:hypothetical protein
VHRPRAIMPGAIIPGARLHPVVAQARAVRKLEKGVLCEREKKNVLDETRPIHLAERLGATSNKLATFKCFTRLRGMKPTQKDLNLRPLGYASSVLKKLCVSESPLRISSK